MKLTEFFRLRMPDGTDPVNIEDFNDNFEVIDKELKKRISSGESASDVTVEFETAESRQPFKKRRKAVGFDGKGPSIFHGFENGGIFREVRRSERAPHSWRCGGIQGRGQ